eukprot:1684561-Rhodomonas_salina.1
MYSALTSCGIEAARPRFTSRRSSDCEKALAFDCGFFPLSDRVIMAESLESVCLSARAFEGESSFFVRPPRARSSAAMSSLPPSSAASNG